MKNPIPLNGVAALFQRNRIFGARLGDVARPQAPEPGERVLNWALSPQDRAIIERVMDRMHDIAVQYGQADTFERMLCTMDLTCVHLNGTPMKLLQLLMCDQDDFTHDVLGIGVHIDRKSGQLRNDWKPRMRVEA